MLCCAVLCNPVLCGDVLCVVQCNCDKHLLLLCKVLMFALYPSHVTVIWGCSVKMPCRWMDDWISSIYGRHRTLLSKQLLVHHHYFRHGQRYKVNRGNEQHLIPATSRGRQLIRTWMLKHDLDVTLFDKQMGTASNKRAPGIFSHT